MQALLAFQKNSTAQKTAIFGARTQRTSCSHMAFKTQLLSALLPIICAKRAEKMPYLVHSGTKFPPLTAFW